MTTRLSPSSGYWTYVVGVGVFNTLQIGRDMGPRRGTGFRGDSSSTPLSFGIFIWLTLRSLGHQEASVEGEVLSWPLLWCCVFCPCVGHAPCLSLPCLPLNCSHLACIVSSTPLQIHLVSLQSSPDRTSCYRGSYSFLAPVYLSSVLSCGILVPHLCFLSPIVFGSSPPACSLHSLQPDTPHSNQPPASLNSRTK